jgi:AcrR family transcriptional regulator
MSPAARRGRRRGAPDTKAAILTAAREAFGEHGFTRTTIRGVAAAAGVDAALVHHYFGSKDELFVAALALPVDPREVLAPVVAAGPDGAGERLMRAFLSVWDDPELQPALLALARTIVEPSGAELARTGFLPVVIGPALRGLVRDQPDVRIPLIASQLIGLIVTRYLVALEPMVALSSEEVVALIGPTVQRYLTDDL